MKNSKFDSKLFLDSIILSESLKSTQIEGTQISQDEMFYLKYMPRTDETSEIQNLKKVIDYSKEFIKKLNVGVITVITSIEGTPKTSLDENIIVIKFNGESFNELNVYSVAECC